MKLEDVKSKILDEAYRILPAGLNTQAANIELLAIGLQETKFESRRQLISKVVEGKKRLVPAGPAASFWQFELGGGVKGVMRHHRTTKLASHVCSELNVPFDPTAIWEAMETNDVLGACFARLLLFSDLKALPAIGDSRGAWLCYLRNWRPGKPHPETWDNYYALAKMAVQG